MIQDVMKLSVEYLEHCHFHEKTPQPFLTIYTPRGMNTLHQRCNNPYHVLPAVVYARHLLGATEVYFSLPMEMPVVRNNKPDSVHALVIFSSQSDVALAVYERVGRQLAWSRVSSATLVMDEFFSLFMASYNAPMPDGLGALIKASEDALNPWEVAFEGLKEHLDVDLAKSCNSHSTG